MAARSHARAAAAQKAGRFDAEIVPVPTTIVDPKTGDEQVRRRGSFVRRRVDGLFFFVRPPKPATSRLFFFNPCSASSSPATTASARA